MNVFILTSYARFAEGAEDPDIRTVGVYRSLKRALEVAAAAPHRRGEMLLGYAVHEWSFPDTYAPVEVQPDGLLEATYHGHGGAWTKSIKDAQGVWEIHRLTTGPHGPHEGAAHGGEEAADGRPAAVEPHPHG